MTNSILLQVISINVLNLFMLVILNIFYFTKPRINRVEHIMFGRLILCSLFGSFFGLLFGILTTINPVVDIIAVFLEKIYNILIIDWILTLGFYTYIISTKKKYNDILVEHLLNYTLLISMILFFVPINLTVFEGKITVSGPLLQVTFIISGIVLLFNVIILVKNVKHIREKKYLPIYSMIILTILFVFIQWLNPDFNYLNSLLGMIIGYLMYFTIENPDVKMIEELTKAQKLSENTSNEKSNFIHIITEDISNKLNNAEKISNNVLELNPENNVKEYMYDLKELINVARTKLNQTIDISDMDIKYLNITNNKYNIKNLLESVYALKKPDVKENIDYKLNISEELPNELYGDSIKLKQILASIIDNSIKHTEQGFIELRVNSIIKNEICRLIITIDDSGTGIDIFKQNEIMSNMGN